jgi:hypothetical protein
VGCDRTLRGALEITVTIRKYCREPKAAGECVARNRIYTGIAQNGFKIFVK